MKKLLHTLFFFFLATQICFGQWYPQNSGTTKHLNKVQFVDANTGWAVGDSGLILYTSNGGADWTQQASGTHHNLLAVCFKGNNTGWAAGGTGEFWNPDSAIIISTTDGGLNWVQQVSIKGNFYDLCFINENVAYVVGYGENSSGQIKPIITKTTNCGLSWSHNFPDLDVSSIYSIKFAESNIGWIIGLRGNIQGAYSIITKTTDNGATWFEQDTLSGKAKVSCFDTNFAVAVSEAPAFGWIGEITKTANGGIDWITVVSEPDWNYYDLSIISSEIITVVGVKWGQGRILRSTDSGQSWTNQNIDSVPPLNGVSFIDDNIGWVVGDNGGILHKTNGGVTFIDNEPTQPTDFILEQNFPNPFNPSTTISWQSPVGSYQTIKVFDVLGNEIATLIDEYKPAGRYEVEFNAERLASGTYFYQLKAGEYTSVKKMILIK